MTDRQKCLIRLLAKNHSLTANQAGDWLARNGLSKPVGAACSNSALPGSAVLNSLVRLGLVVRHGGRDRWSAFDYSLTAEGREAASTLKQEVTP